MDSHIKWGLGFIFAGLILATISMLVTSFTLIYSLPLLAVGLVLLLFGGREKRIEEVVE
ncbi:hypothetical protein [Archaeoglobus veneficus]|uniref:Uncharacterized protein n=1 Tax=Archaeoglobus veneficus (strain DSM 11195 / SNP6) TaxID=693661 RepID=F2KR90_ARCVS|nr:hypothetical protein [Archaeoglobus veneficus]AEA46727.1 hypothetical protein Arcve_0708 [Archaeoglobus veneficus SNP6]